MMWLDDRDVAVCMVIVALIWAALALLVYMGRVGL